MLLNTWTVFFFACKFLTLPFQYQNIFIAGMKKAFVNLKIEKKVHFSVVDNTHWKRNGNSYNGQNTQHSMHLKWNHWILPIFPSAVINLTRFFSILFTIFRSRSNFPPPKCNKMHFRFPVFSSTSVRMQINVLLMLPVVCICIVNGWSTSDSVLCS